MSEPENHPEGTPYPVNHELLKESAHNSNVGHPSGGNVETAYDFDDPAWEKLSNDSRENAHQGKLFTNNNEDEGGEGGRTGSTSFTFDPNQVIYEEETYTLDNKREEAQTGEQETTNKDTPEHLNGKTGKGGKNKKPFWH